MLGTLIAVLVVAGLGFAAWQWWQGQVRRASVQQLHSTAVMQAALALSDPLEGGSLAWEAGMPAYHPAPESSEQHRALLKAWEVTLRDLLEHAGPTKDLPEQLGECLPAMLPVANAGLYIAEPRTLREATSNMRALAATSLLMQRRAQSWLKHNEALTRELGTQLSSEQGVEQVSLSEWRRKVPNAKPATMPEPMPDLSAAARAETVEVP